MLYENANICKYVAENFCECFRMLNTCCGLAVVTCKIKHLQNVLGRGYV